MEYPVATRSRVADAIADDAGVGAQTGKNFIGFHDGGGIIFRAEFPTVQRTWLAPEKRPLHSAPCSLSLSLLSAKHMGLASGRDSRVKRDPSLLR